MCRLSSSCLTIKFSYASLLLQSVTLRRQVNGGAWSAVRQVQYAYHDGTQTYGGNVGDLMTASVLDGNNNVLTTSYCRYYTPGQSGGYTDGLHYVFNPTSYMRLTAALRTNLGGLWRPIRLPQHRRDGRGDDLLRLHVVQQLAADAVGKRQRAGDLVHAERAGCGRRDHDVLRRARSAGVGEGCRRLHRLHGLRHGEGGR
jgi:hypothetical protein